MIPRFCYTTRARSGDCAEGFICPPYGDTSSNGTQGKVLDENWRDRVEVLQAMLDQFSEKLMI